MTQITQIKRIIQILWRGYGGVYLVLLCPDYRDVRTVGISFFRKTHPLAPSLTSNRGGTV